jgi:heme oxygenase (biliverdin-IX-beta and delta-forming)
MKAQTAVSANIKEATKDAHVALEKQVVQRLKGIHSNADYAALLKYFYAYFNHVEKAIAPYITESLLPDYKERRNSSYIKNDILALGSTVDELPTTTVPVIDNHVKALGALYVMEGSIMGGSIIVKMLEKGGITDGVSFFSGYGEATGPMWGEFVAVMNREAVSDDHQADMIRAANETFEHFSKVFEGASIVQ